MKLIQNLEKTNNIHKLLIVFSIISLDQMLKYLSIHVFHSYIFNKGVSFGLLANSNLSLLLSIIALLALVYLIYKSKINSKYMLIIAGGVSNLLDRVIYGAVIDYLNFMNIIWFNLADIYINLGILLIVIVLIKEVFINKTNAK
jgi:lipoprotein signal peptidase